MANATANSTVPRSALIAAGIIIAASVVAAGIGRFTGFGTLRMPESVAVEYRDLRFADLDDGAVQVRDAENDRVVTNLPAGSDGFVRGVLRSLVRDRKGRGINDDIPFRLSRQSNGHLVLEDRATAQRITLNAFGPTNVDAFARLLSKGEGRQ